MAEKKRWRSTGKTAIKRSRQSKVKEDRRKELKHGERRRGPNGKMNIYDKNKGRWVRAESYEPEKGYGKRSNTSGTVSSAKSTPKRTRNLGLGGNNSGKRVLPKDRNYQYTPGRDQVKMVRGRPNGPKKLQVKVGVGTKKDRTGSRRERTQKRR